MLKYSANDTMELIGKQNLVELKDIEPNLQEVIKDIMTANGIPEEFIGDKIFMLGVNAVQYGIILGKRIERQRKKSKYGLFELQRDIDKESKGINERYREDIRKMIEQTEDTHVLCCTYTLIRTYLRIRAEKGGAK